MEVQGSPWRASTCSHQHRRRRQLNRCCCLPRCAALPSAPLLPLLQEEAAALGKSSFAFAFYMDRQKEERERGVTISCTTKEFFTERYHYTIIDAPGACLRAPASPLLLPLAVDGSQQASLVPGRTCSMLWLQDSPLIPNHYSRLMCPAAGHRDFIKNMISGAAQADVCLLMVPADGNFTTAIQKGDHKAGEIQGQTRQHARLLNLLGVKQLVVGVNKMDADTAGYKQVRL